MLTALICSVGMLEKREELVSDTPWDNVVGRSEM